MKKLKTWQIVLLVIFYPVGLVYFIIWLVTRNKQRQSNSQRIDSSNLEIIKDFHTKVVGVTFNNENGTSRQTIIKACKPGDDVIFKPTPTKEYPDSVGVFNAIGKQLGNLNAELASELKNQYSKNPMSVTVSNVTGGGDYNYGCNLHVVIYVL